MEFSVNKNDNMLSIEHELQTVEEELKSTEVEIKTLLNKQTVLQEKRSLLKKQLSTLKESEKQAHNWSSEEFEWSKSLRDQLKDVFGISKLRQLQLETINTTMSGQDCILIMPTGGGKSLCYQLPAILSKGVTLVISPLVSLMEDQVMALDKFNIPAVMLNASTSKETVNVVHRDMTKSPCPIKLIYVTPEKIAKSKRFMNKLEHCYKAKLLSRIAIDEVHCCSQWGHDFRPDYKILGILKRQFPEVPILGLTATASGNVLADVQKILQLPYAQVYKASFNRANLFYRVLKKPSSHNECITKISSMIKTQFQNQSGIVYCFSRKDSETVAKDLMNAGIKCACYHADLPPSERSYVHTKWTRNKIHVIVATIAFGMGIDKPDVRFVIHHSMSKSMENYYQESGRAGRDGERAECILLYRLADLYRQSCMVFTEVTGLEKLYKMVDYCLSQGVCRRKVIASHFSEMWNNNSCNQMCDQCQEDSHTNGLSNKNVADDCKLVYEILDLAKSKDVRMTSLKVLDAMLGKGPTNLRPSRKTKIPLEQCEHLIAFMLIKSYLREDFHFTPYSTVSYLLPAIRFTGSELCIHKSSKRTFAENESESKIKKKKLRVEIISDSSEQSEDEVVVLV